MSRKISRNDPCPCGSGQKYKKCCLGKERVASVLPPEAEPLPPGRFRFEAGSYGEEGTNFAPAALCRKRTDDGAWAPHFVLANPAAVCGSRVEAADLAARHLDMAFAVKARTGADQGMAMALRSVGYMNVDGYRLVDFQPAVPGEWDVGTEAEARDEDAGALAAILEVVEEQIRDGDPPETRRTLQRLISMGHDENEAKKLIGAVLSVELFGVLKYQEQFDEERYVEALRQLPELPEALRDA